MLQTALMLAAESTNNATASTTTSVSGDNTPVNNRSIENSPRRPDTNKDKHKRNKSIDFSTIEVEGNEKKLRKAF